MEIISKWLNKHNKPTQAENTYTPKKRIAIQSTIDMGQGLSFNEKAEHIFGEIKKLNTLKS